MQRTDSLRLHIRRADNQLVVYMNGQIVFDESTEGDPQLDINLDLTGRLRGGVNKLKIVGLDWGYRAHFDFTVIPDGEESAFYMRKEGRPPGRIQELINETYYFRH